MDKGNILEADGFFFIHNFDSGNLGHVERVPKELIQSSLNHKTNALETPEYEFNLWTRPDCAGTEFENGNRTWFYFGVQGGQPGALVRLNVINLNKQGKMYNQGMAPVTRTLPGKPQWERIRDRPIHSTDDNTFMISFKYRTAENLKATTFFAFTYPFSFAELQIALNSIDLKFLPPPPNQSLDDIYYCRENLIYTLEGRRTDLLTISSHHCITNEREERLKNLFPDRTERPFKFLNKKIIFVSARVHPGETPSSFVFNGFLNLILTKHDPIALQLRRLYVFKMVPFLNPDGVARGHYRTDTRGVNLNRVYLNPSLEHHPTVYAARALIRYHHFGCEKDEDSDDIRSMSPGISHSIRSINEEPVEPKKKKPLPSVKNSDNVKRCTSPTLKASPSSLRSPSNTKPSPSPEVKKVTATMSTGDTLADQVCELKLQEMSSRSGSPSSKSPPTYVDKTSSTSTFVVDNCPSLLDDVVIRDCLGSEVHLSRSDELNINGPNPLRQLRDTLKNSISLLIGANSYPIIPSDSSGQRDSRSEESAMKIGWCRECRATVGNVEEHLAAIAELTSSQDCNANTSKHESTVSSEQYMFCSNCLKKYPTSEIEQEIKVTETTSEVSETVSAGDGADVKRSSEHSSEEAVADSNGDSVEFKTKAALKPKKKQILKVLSLGKAHPKVPESGLYLYIDLHGHASKKGIFMYGNHFEELESSVECMLLPRIMSLNNLHFHFSSCNFTERNMYLRDRRDGMSREGSGRVAVLKATGLVRSYTLECNYNTGRLVNVLPPPAHGPAAAPGAPSDPATPAAPPKYTPHIFEEVGRSLGSSILDLTGHHPNSRVPGSEHRSLASVRDWLRAHTRNMRPPQLTVSRLRPKTASPSRVPLYARSLTKAKLADAERKENTYIGAKPEGETKKPTAVRSGRSNEVIVNRFAPKKTEHTKVFGSRSRHCSESETKPKALSVKRRSVLAIRKPNAGKARSIKSKTCHTRRTADEAETTRSTISSKVSKNAAGTFAVRSFRRDGPGARAESELPEAAASSSSSDVGGWEDAAGGARADAAPLAGKRRPYPPPPSLPVPHLKKIRLKTTS